MRQHFGINRKRAQRLMRLLGLEAAQPRRSTRDNVFVERRWRTVTHGEVCLRDYADGREAEKSLGKYFDFYRTERPHQALGYRTPMAVYQGG